MNQLVGEFLVLSRELQKESPQQTDLDELLEELVENARNEGAKVEWHPHAGALITAGPMALRRILSNLLGNAIRYSENKPVQIDFEMSAETAVIRILDRGPGIPSHEIENVFRPFYRREPSRSAATGGSGLGLAIARQLSDANGWKVELLARSEGGTEARLSIPISH
jgi:two-component system osmolarity sensor histidine kinase EnvZ